MKETWAIRTEPKINTHRERVYENVKVVRKDGLDDEGTGVKSEKHDRLLRGTGGQREHKEDVGPPGANVLPLRLDQLCHTSHHHVLDVTAHVWYLLEDVHKWPAKAKSSLKVW